MLTICLRKRTTLRILAFILLILLCLIILNQLSRGAVLSVLWPRPCRLMSREMRVHLLEITAKVHRTLDLLKITHFVCYGTLWGAAKRQTLLPWENNVDFCALNEDIQNHDENFLMRSFRKWGLHISYDSQTGVYTISKGDISEGTLNLYVFENVHDLKIYRRIGWKHRLLPPTSDLIDSFPSRLVERPLPTVKLAGMELPGPHEGIEIQKYHYKDNWWKDMKPENCPVTS